MIKHRLNLHGYVEVVANIEEMYVLIYCMCAHTHTHTHTYTQTRGRGDLIKCRQWLCGLAYSGARPQAATATVHLGQLDVASKPGQP